MAQVIEPLSIAVIVLSVLLMAVAGWYAWRDRLIDDRLLLLAALIELGVVVQAVVALMGMGRIADGEEKATFAAYALTLPFVPLGTAFLAIKEKSRWAMGAIGIGGMAVAVMSVRLQQIWGMYA